jgi:hypothetical protein
MVQVIAELRAFDGLHVAKVEIPSRRTLPCNERVKLWDLVRQVAGLEGKAWGQVCGRIPEGREQLVDGAILEMAQRLLGPDSRWCGYGVRSCLTSRISTFIPPSSTTPKSKARRAM